MKEPITKESTFEEANKAVQGTRTMLVMKFKPFLEASFGIEDLFAAADEGIARAFKEWEPEQSKFNTFAHNHMTWAINDYLNEMNSVFKFNAITTYELTREGESFKEVKEIGKTKDKEFNLTYFEEFQLDGTDYAKARITRDVFNKYVTYQTQKRRPWCSAMTNVSQFVGDGSEDFDILDTSDVCDTYNSTDFEWDSFSIPKDEMEQEMELLSEDKKQIAQFIIDGVSVSDMAKHFKLTQNAFMQKFAPESGGKRGKVKSKKAMHGEKVRAQREAQREAEEA